MNNMPMFFISCKKIDPNLFIRTLKEGYAVNQPSGSGFTIAHLLGWVKITQFHFSIHLVTVLLLNMIIAFFYEAFPEELTFRGVCTML